MVNHPHIKKTLFLVLLSFLFISSVGAGEYFDITETFSQNNYGNMSVYDSNQFVKQQDGNIEWYFDNQWFIRMGQHIPGLVFNNSNKLVYDPYGSGFARHHYILNISRCQKDECYLSPQTRIEMYLEYESESLAPAQLVPRIAFKKYYWGSTNDRFDFNSTENPFDVLSGVGTGQYNLTAPISLTYRSNAGWEPFCNLTGFLNPTTHFLNVTLGDLPTDNPLCKVYYNDRIDGFFINIWQEDGGISPNQNITEFKIYNLFNGTNQLPYFNVTANQTYYCVNESSAYPVNVWLNWSVVDLENDTIQYAYNYDLSEKKFYKDYSTYHQALFFNSWDPDFDSLGDDTWVNHSGECQFCDNYLCHEDTNELAPFTSLSADYSNVPTGWDGFGLQLKNDCVGYDIYRVKTKFNYKEFHYNTSIYGLGNGENYTIQFLDQDFNDIVNFLVKGDGGNLTLSSSDGTNYQELYDETVNYNITSIELNYYDDGHIYFAGRTKNYWILSNNHNSSYVVKSLGENDFISYVLINFSNNDYMLQSMYAYQGEAQALNWTTTQLSTVPILMPGIHTVNIYVKDTLHDDYSKDSFTIKIEEKDYCFSGQSSFPVIDTLIGNPLSNFFDYFGLQAKYRTVIYWTFLIFIIIFMTGIYKSTGQFEIFTSSMFSSLICFGISFLVRDTPTMITFIITFVVSVIFVGIRR